MRPSRTSGRGWKASGRGASGRCRGLGHPEGAAAEAEGDLGGGLDDEALQNTSFWAPLAPAKEQKHDITHPVEMERAADALPIEQIASRWIVGSDPDEVVAAIAKYLDWGFNQRRFLELFERDLAPRLRAL